MERAIKVAVILTDDRREWDDRKAECEAKGNPWLETDEDNWERKKKYYGKIGQIRQKTNFSSKQTGKLFLRDAEQKELVSQFTPPYAGNDEPLVKGNKEENPWRVTDKESQAHIQRKSWTKNRPWNCFPGKLDPKEKLPTDKGMVITVTPSKTRKVQLNSYECQCDIEIHWFYDWKWESIEYGWWTKQFTDDKEENLGDLKRLLMCPWSPINTTNCAKYYCQFTNPLPQTRDCWEHHLASIF